MTAPIRFALLGDQHGFLWWHECVPLDVSHLEPDVAEWYHEQRRKPRELPLAVDAWHLIKADPLTISPSILCGSCGLHGFITEGAWVQV